MRFQKSQDVPFRATRFPGGDCLSLAATAVANHMKKASGPQHRIISIIIRYKTTIRSHRFNTITAPHLIIVMTNTKFYNPSTAPFLNPKSDRRVVLITGANSGIGLLTALQLYLHGYIVYIGGRTESKAKQAIVDIEKLAEDAANQYSEVDREQRHFGELKFLYIDLLDLDVVNKAADEFLELEPKLDILINNAGLMGVPFEVTKDGHENQYQVNFVSHFLLTLKLIPSLQAVANSGRIPRVVGLTSLGHHAAVKYYAPSDLIHKTPNFAFTWVRYGRAKSAIIQATRALSKKYPEILSVSVHPGVIIGTELYNHWKNLKFIGIFAKGAFKAIDTVGGISVEEGTLGTLKCALDPGLDDLKENGSYFMAGGLKGLPSKVASSDKNAATTWDWHVAKFKEKYTIPSLENE